MELRGDFESYAEILDLLQIISMGKKSGEVNLRNPYESVSILFKEGNAVDFLSTSSTLKALKERVKKGEISFNEALNFLLHHVSLWEKGKFVFTEKEVESAENSVDTLNLMMNFTKEEDELPKEVKQAIKNNQTFALSLNAQLPITLNERSWRILVEVCRGTPIWHTLLKVGTSFSEDTKTLATLMKHNLIEECQLASQKIEAAPNTSLATSSAVVPDEKIEKIRELLVETMGPMGEFLIEETLEEMETEKLHIEQVLEFIENLLDKIPESCLIDGEKCRDRLKEQFKEVLTGGVDEP